jgi:hypothetical protein
LPWSQKGGDQLTALTFIDVEGLIAIIAIVGIEPGELLIAVSDVVGIIDIESDRFGRSRVRIEEKIDQGLAHAIEIARTHAIFQAAPRRLCTQRVTAEGQAMASGFERRIVTSHITVIRIFIATSDLKDALAHEVFIRMIDIALMATIDQDLAQALDDLHLRLKRSKK